jgi:hypothetical protein
MIDLDKLKKLTAEAVERGRLAAEEAEKKRLEKEERKRKAAERKAQNVIDQIPDRAEREAKEGRNHAIVMSVKFDDYKRPSNENNFSILKPEWMVGACKIVYDYCKQAGLNPTLEYWWSGDGVDSGHNIVIHW